MGLEQQEGLIPPPAPKDIRLSGNLTGGSRQRWPWAVCIQGPNYSPQEALVGMSPEPRVGGQVGGIFYGKCMEKVYECEILVPGHDQHQPQEVAEMKIGARGP